ncbi:N-6 DNA methylase [Streptomyces inhibens]|uniref:N-6 DNA methylase n=1 Tax=Streptomyces inhibens TaxID=2293571 RepID=UPI001EE6F333|nr:N-6 DNA methylase [Streptomyces inhibens]UKY53181.1 N-6 DNA methylase [Streptomyces inhibens]
MSYTYDSFANRGEYLSAHYFSEELENTLKRSKAGDAGLFTLWTSRETDPHDPQPTPRELLPRLRGEYLSTVRPFLASRAQQEEFGSTYDDPTGEWTERVTTWHTTVLKALGYSGDRPGPITVHNAGREYALQVAWHGDGILAVDCGWTAKLDDALDPDKAGRLLHPHKTADSLLEVGEKLAGWLFQSELHEPGGDAPRFVLLLCGGVLVLGDRNAWAEGRYLAASLDAALTRNDTAKAGELALLAALFSHDMLAPRPDGKGRRIDDLLNASRDNAVGVNSELRKGLQHSVEIIANEVLARLRKAEVEPREIEDLKKGPFAKQLTRESLRYLYRILFLLYAEARPELGILPADDSTYEAGYSIARLRELVARERKLVDEDSRGGFHLYASLDVLFNKVNYGHRPHGTEADDDKPAEERSELRGLRFEPLRSELFDPRSITLIGGRVLDPRWDEDGDEPPRWLDLRLRNEALHQVLRLLTMKEAGQKGRQGGFISYRNLSINQLGAVYEGLISYTGIIADEELAEVAKPGARQGDKQYGDPEKGSWLIPADRLSQYRENTHVVYSAQDAEQYGLRGPKKYPEGTFVYRLAGRDRETSASYYTPQSLTKVTVELALKHRITDETRASELLRYTICEPALGSGAFLNEAINQVAEEYLKRRQAELGVTLDTSKSLDAKQKVKAYIALHNAYGIDLNPTGVELAEVSLWLNTMHPGMRAPWFGLHLRHGNSLIGARRWVYEAERIKKERAIGAQTPTKLPFREKGNGAEQPLPDGAVHQFLLPTPGWGAVAGASGDAKKLAEQLAGPHVEHLKAWKNSIKAKPKTVGGKSSQLARLQAAARRVEFLWQLVAKRMELSEREIARTIDVWGTGREEDAEEYAFLRRDKESAGDNDLPQTKERVFKDLFEAEGSPYWRLKQVMDAWCALWFWPLDKVGLLDGTDAEYETAPVVSVDALLSAGVVGEVGATSQAEPEPEPRFVENGLLFALEGDQMSFGDDSGDGDLVEKQEIRKKRVAEAGAKKRGGPTQRRDIVPMADLDDWLDFLESMLGTKDVKQGTIVSSVESLEELKDLEDLIQTQPEMDMDDARKAVESRYPWMRVVRDIAKEQGFLHWELDFAGVFASEAGGFDLQVGNPPWVRPRWNESLVLAEREPWFELEERVSTSVKAERRDDLLKTPAAATYVVGEITDNVGQVAFYGAPQVYPLLEGTQPDLYRAFMCQVWDHASVRGTTGFLHSDTHFTGDREGALRGAAYRRLRIHGDFVNSGQRFFPRPVGDATHFGVHVYGRPQDIDFSHLSWLVSADALRLSANHDGSGEAPGIRYQNGEFDERPHRTRVVHVNRELLTVWKRLFGDTGPVDEARLLFPVSTAEATAIEALANYPLRLSAFKPQITPGYHESGAKKDRLIDYNRPDPKTGEPYEPDRWRHVILKGTQISVATPVFKRHDANSNAPFGADLVSLPSDFVPDTEYVRVPGRAQEYLKVQDRWIDHQALERLREDDKAVARARAQVAETTGNAPQDADPEKVDALLVGRAQRRYTAFYRVAWREMIAPNTERSLYPAVVPPGTAHTNVVRSTALRNNHLSVLASGLWSSVPIDYLLRITGTGHLDVGRAGALPAPAPAHPLAPALLLRTLRLNCLTTAYADLWQDLYDPTWSAYEPWALSWPVMNTELHAVTPTWQRDTPLRTEYARRAALVEIDALVAVWLGMDADALIAAYKGRFPVLQKYEAASWFDAEGWKLASNARTIGQRQTKETWTQFEAYREAVGEPSSEGVLPAGPNATPPHGYTAPFYKANREREMREAHAYFQKRLDEAVSKGLWDPEKMEVPTP